MWAVLLGALLMAVAVLCAAAGRRRRPSDMEMARSLLDRFLKLDLLAPRPAEGERPSGLSSPEPREAPRGGATKPRKRRVSQLRKKKVAARDGWRCKMCRKLVDHTFEIDHILAVSRGGMDEESNLRLLCRSCHGLVTAQQRLGEERI
jgi:hypothetical protein